MANKYSNWWCLYAAADVDDVDDVATEAAATAADEVAVAATSVSTVVQSNNAKHKVWFVEVSLLKVFLL